MELEVLKSNFLSSSDYSRVPNGRFKEEQIRDSLQSVLMMQKCQVGIKDNPRLDFDLEMLQFCLDNGISSDVSKGL